MAKTELEIKNQVILEIINELTNNQPENWGIMINMEGGETLKQLDKIFQKIMEKVSKR